MVRSHILSLILLFVCATSVHGMEPGNDRENDKSDMNFFIEVGLPSLGATVMTSLITSFQASNFLLGEKVSDYVMPYVILAGMSSLYFGYCHAINDLFNVQFNNQKLDNQKARRRNFIFAGIMTGIASVLSRIHLSFHG